METRKESISALKVCRFCLTQNEPLLSLYEKNKAPQNVVTLSMKILTCIGVEIYPSDKMPQHICNKCKFFMELFYGFKHICRKSDLNILHFIQNGTPIEPINWAALLNKVFRLYTKSEFGLVKSVTQDGATVKVTAEELSDSGEEGDDDNVYSVKIEDGSDEMKSIKVITSVDNQEPKGNKKGQTGFANMTKLAKHLRTHAGERAYPCKHCDKSFLKSHHYTRHLRLKHSELIRAPSDSVVEPELSYRCEECEECFTTQDELIYHSALHATRSLTCPLCQEKFDDVDTVTSHIKSHVNGAEYMCDFCELIFTTQDKLDMHIASSHESELNDKDMTQNEEEEDGESMDTEGYEDDSLINVKEEDGHMLVEIKKAGEYMLAEPEAMEDDDETENYPSEDANLEITLDASGPLLASKPAKADESAPKPVKEVCSVLSAVKRNIGSPNAKNISVIVNTGTPVIEKPVQQKNVESPIIRKVEIKRKIIQHQSPVPNITDKKEKNNSKVESVKVESSSAAGASDLSLRLLEKELQDLQRTNSRNDVSKTTAKSMDTLRSKRSQIHTSTPKPRAAEKKEVVTPKSAPEKPVQEKRPPGRPPKENKEVKNASVREEKEVKEKANASIREDKETKEVKETQVIKNGADDNTSADEPVRRSTRPSKVKDYAKMIRDSPDEEEETSEEELEEDEPKETEKSMETPRRGRKPKPPTAAPATPASAPRKRGRPRRKDPSPIPPKVKKEDSENEDDPEPNSSTTKPEERQCKDTTPAAAAELNTSLESKAAVSASVDPASNVIVSPSGQTLKKVPIKALPPGVKPMPLPRKLPSVTEMQIGKKMVKVQKIVMTKAEVEAMTKKGLVEMKDGTIVLKPGIKLPGSATALKSPVASQEKKEAPPPRPTRCDLGED